MKKVIPFIALGAIWGVAQGFYNVFRGNGFIELAMTLIQAAAIGYGVYLIWKGKRKPQDSTNSQTSGSRGSTQI